MIYLVHFHCWPSVVFVNDVSYVPVEEVMYGWSAGLALDTVQSQYQDVLL